MRHMLLLLACLAALVPEVRAQAPVALARSGWEALNAGRAAEALAAFEKALESAPRNPSLLLGAGVAAQVLGRGDSARRYLVDALRQDATLTEASLVLGEILYREGDLDGAIHSYELALVHEPNHAQIAKRLEAWRKERDLHSRFGQKLGDRFTVLFEGPAEEQLAQQAVALLDSAYWRIGSALYTYPADIITVVLYTREQFRDVTQSPDWAGGAYDGRIRVPVQGALQNMKEFERVLAHEFTHALIRSLAPRNVPIWLNEGLAVHFEGSDPSRRRTEVRNAPELIPLQRLEKAFDAMDTKTARLAYAQSAVAVQAMLDLGGPPALVNILTDIGNGASFTAAFERHMFMSYDEFQKKLQSTVQDGDEIR
jgi:tetratricopeptide (TPR) repeat protein